MDLRLFERQAGRLWAITEFSVFLALLAMVYNIIWARLLTAYILGPITSAAGSSPYWSGSHGTGSPWQWTGPHGNEGYWLEQTEKVLDTMQSTYWNGTYWPTTIQWVGALVNTIVASTERTWTNDLGDSQYQVPVATIQSNIHKYFSQIEAYYGGEDTNQIFDAAYDDAQWVVLEWLEAIKFVNQNDGYAKSMHGQSNIAEFAHRAHIFYNIVQDKYNTSQCEGGITWNPTLATYKNAITNELFVSSSIAMYLYFPGDSNTDPYPSPTYRSLTNITIPDLPVLKAHDPVLLQNAKEEWAWFKTHNFTNAQGLIVDGFHISDGQTTCDQRNEMVYTYNQGVMLSGLRGLWEATGDTDYLDDGYSLISTTINATGWNALHSQQADQWAGLGRNGIMEDYCDAPANCSQDDLVFKGAYFEHLDLFCEPLPIDTPLVAGLTGIASPDLATSHAEKCQNYAPWVQHNAYAALSTQNSSGLIGEWWGASYVNKTQAPWPAYTHPKPSGSIDIANEPQLLDSWPWACEPGRGCDDKRRPLAHIGRRHRRRSTDRVRTIETQAQGLSVVRAAVDFTAWKNYRGYFHE